MIRVIWKLVDLFKPSKSRVEGLLYQYYAQVHYLTCEECLKRHGDIFSSEDKKPPIHQDCRCDFLQIPKEELTNFKSKAERMKKAAQKELERRKLILSAKEKLEENPDKSFELFQQAADIEIYLGEIEQLLKENGQILAENPAFVSKLRNTFTKYYRWKFGKRRYEVWPEPMRVMREKAGVKRIEELFDEIKQ